MLIDFIVLQLTKSIVQYPIWVSKTHSTYTIHIISPSLLRLILMFNVLVVMRWKRSVCLFDLKHPVCSDHY